MPLIILACGIVLLFCLVILVKLNGFLSLLLAALFVGLLQGMDFLAIVTSIEAGLGGTLGHLGLIIALGAILGKLLSDGGGAQRIATTFINTFGEKHVEWGMCMAAFVLGAILFWEVSFVLLLPIVYTVAMEARVRLLRVAIPFVMSITIAHCFLPPHPGPVAIAGIFNANLGLVLFYGLLVSIPAAVIFGPGVAKLYKWDVEIPHNLATRTDFKEEEMPGFGISLLTALAPVFLILIGVVVQFIMPKGFFVTNVLRFIGHADIAMLLAVLMALYVFGTRGQKRTIGQQMKSVEAGLMSMGAILFVIGGGGAFKQVILDSGIDKYIAQVTSMWAISPLVLGWLVTVCIRFCVGSATVTVLTASAIVLPIQQASGASPELMVLAIATASIFGGPPNDAAFWMVKEYFNLSITQTVKFWSVQASLLAIFGLLGVLSLNMILF
ncbi:gluconate transporter [Deltaproteobacteria bacterium]|nr:gluconate transporter [Deltaproteobacteria bacterium]